MNRALRILRVILAAATVAVCLLLCWQAVDLYLAGNSPDNFSAPGVRINPVYTRELVAERLAAVSPVLLAYLALAVAGLALQAAAGEKKPKNARRKLEIPRPVPQKGRTLTALRVALYAAAFALIALGVANGGLWDVLVKAVNICTECIGLG